MAMKAQRSDDYEVGGDVHDGSQVRRRVDPARLSRETVRASREDILSGAPATVARPAAADPHVLFQQIAAKIIAEGARRDAERASREAMAVSVTTVRTELAADAPVSKASQANSTEEASVTATAVRAAPHARRTHWAPWAALLSRLTIRISNNGR
jgi:hypothetical protein